MNAEIYKWIFNLYGDAHLFFSFNPLLCYSHGFANNKSWLQSQNIWINHRVLFLQHRARLNRVSQIWSFPCYQIVGVYLFCLYFIIITLNFIIYMLKLIYFSNRILSYMAYIASSQSGKDRNMPLVHSLPLPPLSTKPLVTIGNLNSRLLVKFPSIHIRT